MAMTDDNPFLEGTPRPNEPDLERPPDELATRRATKTATTTPPPHDTNAEKAVLGAALINPAAADILTTLNPDAFYTPIHAHIAHAIQTLLADGQPIDPVTVQGRTTDQGVDLALSEILALAADTPTTNASAHADRVRRLHAARQVHQHATAAALAAHTGNPHAATPHLEDATTAADTATAPTSIGATTLVEEHLELIEARYNADGGILGIPTGLHDLDHTTGGFRGGQLIVAAGRPAMGKTALACQLALNTAAHGHNTLLVSIEMGRNELADRLLANLAKVDSTHLRDGQLSPNDWERLTPALSSLSALPLTIDDHPNHNALTIAAAARRHHADIVIIDYLQLVVPHRRAENRQLEVTETTRALKRTARELDIPVIALAQLNRSVETRSDKHPQLSDLRESGSVEQEADIVIGLYRDDYYKADSPDKGVLELGLLKHRAGATKTIRTALLLHYSAVANLAHF